METPADHMNVIVVNNDGTKAVDIRKVLTWGDKDVMPTFETFEGETVEWIEGNVIPNVHKA